MNLGVTKIPSPLKIKNRIENLESEKIVILKEMKELQKTQKTLNIIQQNFSTLLTTQNIKVTLPLQEEVL